MTVFLIHTRDTKTSGRSIFSSFRLQNIILCSTDFYVESSPDQTLGFPPGIAEKLVVNTLRNWQNVKTVTDTQIEAEAPPLAFEEIEVAGNEVNSERIDPPSPSGEKVIFNNI